MASGKSEIALAWSGWRWVMITVLHARRLDALGAQLRRRRLLGPHVDVPVDDRAERAEVRPRADRDGAVEAGVDQQRPALGCSTQEALDRRLSHLSFGTPSPNALRHAIRPSSRRNQAGGPWTVAVRSGWSAHLRALAAARERQLGRAWLCCGGHRARTLARASSSQNSIMCALVADAGLEREPRPLRDVVGHRRRGWPRTRRASRGGRVAARSRWRPGSAPKKSFSRAGSRSSPSDVGRLAAPLVERRCGPSR